MLCLPPHDYRCAHCARCFLCSALGADAGGRDGGLRVGREHAHHAHGHGLRQVLSVRPCRSCVGACCLVSVWRLTLVAACLLGRRVPSRSLALIPHPASLLCACLRPARLCVAHRLSLSTYLLCSFSSVSLVLAAWCGRASSSPHSPRPTPSTSSWTCVDLRLFPASSDPFSELCLHARVPRFWFRLLRCECTTRSARLLYSLLRSTARARFRPSPRFQLASASRCFVPRCACCSMLQEGVRLYVDGVLRIDQWSATAASTHRTVASSLLRLSLPAPALLAC